MNKSSLSLGMEQEHCHHMQGIEARMICHLLFIHYTLIYKSCPMSERKYLSVNLIFCASAKLFFKASSLSLP